MGGGTTMRLTCIVLAVLHSSISISCATSRRQLLQQQGDTTITFPFDQLPPLPVSFRQQPQPQQQPPQQQQGPQAQWQQQQQPEPQPQAQWQQQQGPPQQQRPQQGGRQQANIDNLAASSAVPSTVAHAPSVAFEGQQQQQQGSRQQANIDNLAARSAVLSTVAHAPSLAFGAPTPAANVGLQLPGSMQHAQTPQVPAAAPAQAAAAAQAAQLQAAAQPAANPEGSACLAATKQLVGGECLPFMAEFQMRGPALAKMSAAEFRQAVAIGPTPTDQCCRDAKAFVTQATIVGLTPTDKCCRDARAFVTQACACNPVAAAAAPSVGLTAEDLQLSAKASVMSCPHFGFSDPCAQA